MCKEPLGQRESLGQDWRESTQCATVQSFFLKKKEKASEYDITGQIKESLELDCDERIVRRIRVYCETTERA